MVTGGAKETTEHKSDGAGHTLSQGVCKIRDWLRHFAQTRERCGIQEPEEGLHSYMVAAAAELSGLNQKSGF